MKGSSNTKMKEEVTALKARIVSMERTQSSVVRAAVKVYYKNDKGEGIFLGALTEPSSSTKACAMHPAASLSQMIQNLWYLLWSHARRR